ncbi:hypothetical protein EF910_32025 [Streptomyces sp. WAC07149]|uniref:hypothetical protein n=1 Tax=Streptomyces sp. WAC07149 TaxID=2487425 RepID=UPI000F7A2365|nr:hypothetical protein [Streptomyces sp. WAC07149]RST00365.1 hypothetical protein EF910_32025 [Streptomyces sp. WAC07149]
MRWRMPDGDPKLAAQKSTKKDLPPQENPVSSGNFRLEEIDGYRPGTFRSDSVMHPDVESGAWRPSGSYSPSVFNVGEGKRTAESRKAVLNDDTEYDYALGCYQDPSHASHTYRSGRPKRSGAARVNRQFLGGAESGYKEG